MADVVAAMPIGAIAKDPVEVDHFFVIPKRVSPSKVPPPRDIRLQLPDPPGPDIDFVLRTSNGIGLAQNTRTMTAAAIAALHLAPAQADVVRGLLGELADTFERNPGPDKGAQRVAARHDVEARLEVKLGGDLARAYQIFLDRWVSDYLLNAPSDI